MGRGFHFPKWLASHKRRPVKLRASIRGLSPHTRRLACEALEDRRLLTNITGNVTWATTPYVLTDDVHVLSGGTLTILPSVQVQGSYGLYVNSGGSLSASNVIFQNSRVELDNGALVSLAGDTFSTSIVHVALQLADHLAGNTFLPSSTVYLGTGSDPAVTGTATVKNITNVTYEPYQNLSVNSGGSLTVEAGATIANYAGYSLTINNGGTLTASSATFQLPLYLDNGALVSLAGDTFSTSIVHVALQLADHLAGNTFLPSSTVYLGTGSDPAVTGTATVKNITNVTYEPYQNLSVNSGGSLTVEAGATIANYAGYSLTINNGGTLTASSATFQLPLYLDNGALVSLAGDTFSTSIVHVALQLADHLAGNTFLPSSTVYLGTGSDPAVTGTATVKNITNVTYEPYQNLSVNSGGSLTVEAGATIANYAGYSLTINNGGTLTASSATFQLPLYLDNGALVSLAGDTFSTSIVHVALQLADHLAGNTFLPSSTVYLGTGSDPAVTGTATVKNITNVTYEPYQNLSVNSGGSLTVEAGATIANYAGYSLTINNGGTLTASSATFQLPLYLDNGALVSLAGDTFSTSIVHVALQLADHLAGNTFLPSSTVYLGTGSDPAVTGTATVKNITNVTYEPYQNLSVNSGGSLTVEAGATIANYAGYSLTINNGGTLTASSATFQLPLYLDNGALVSLAGDTFSTSIVHVALQLADHLAGNTFLPSSTVYLGTGSDPAVTGTATVKNITNVTYEPYQNLSVNSGGSLTVEAGATIANYAGYSLTINNGGTLTAENVTFGSQLYLNSGSMGLLEFDKFAYASGYNYFDSQMAVIVTNNDFSASKAGTQGNVGLTVNLRGNYWGSTDLNWIGQNKIYDRYYPTAHTYLAVIDFSSPLAAWSVPPAPTLYGPANGSTGQSATPAFSWSAVGGASLYEILVATVAADLPTAPSATSGGPSVVWSATPTWTCDSPSPALSAGTKYYWEVHALSRAQWGVWSSVYSFTTAAACLAAPALIGPGSGAFPGQPVTVTQPTFQWQTVPGADQYALYIRQMNADGSQGPIVFNSQTQGVTIPGSSTMYVLPSGFLQDGGYYRWNMNSHSGAGWSTAYSTPLYFSVAVTTASGQYNAAAAVAYAYK